MPLLDEAGQLVEDRWTTLADDAAPLPADMPVIVSLARLLAEPALADGTLGVLLPVGAAVEDLAPHLPRLALVALPLPIFRDGRAFTQARTLREHFGFAGEIRATGHILPDQYVALLRCGVTRIALPDGADPAPWQEALRLHAPQRAGAALPFLRRAAIPFETAARSE